MKKSRVLFVSHEIFPYVEGNEMGQISRIPSPGLSRKEGKKSELLCLVRLG
jgi:hypothetical protein